MPNRNRGQSRVHIWKCEIILEGEQLSKKPIIAMTTDHECDCEKENENVCYFVTIHETEHMDDDGLDHFMLHGDDYENDNTGDSAYNRAYKIASDILEAEGLN